VAEWEINSAETIQFEESPSDLQVDLVAGDLTVSGSDGPPSLEVRHVNGPPLQVRLEAGRLEVVQKDPPFTSRLGLMRRSASVLLAVPPGCRARLGTVSASVLAAGLADELSVKTVSGEITLESVQGPVRIETVSGNIAARGVSGELRGQTVSGELTLETFSGSNVRLDSVSGEVTADIKEAGAASSAEVNTASGSVFLRLADSPSQRVRVESVSGRLTSSFPELVVRSGPGSRSINGALGDGRGRVEVHTVSGEVALLGEAAT
jgi:Putative adhesin